MRLLASKLLIPGWVSDHFFRDLVTARRFRPNPATCVAFSLPSDQHSIVDF